MRLVYVRDHDGNLREQLEPIDGPRPIEPLDLATCRDILRRNVIGRLGFLRHDRPILLPVTYGVAENDDVVFRTARGSKLWVAEHEQFEAAFEVDEYDASGRGVSVIVHGPMSPVTDLAEAKGLSRLGVEPWADAIERPRWVRLRPTRVEGWAFPGP